MSGIDGKLKDDRRIDDINLSTRTSNALLREGIQTVSQLLGLINDKEDFNVIRGFGEKAQEETINRLHALGYEFSYEQNEVEFNKYKEITEQLKQIDAAYKELESRYHQIDSEKKVIQEGIDKLLMEIQGSIENEVDQSAKDTLDQALGLFEEQAILLADIEVEFNKISRNLEMNRQTRERLANKLKNLAKSVVQR